MTILKMLLMVMMSSFLFADYYSSIDTRLDGVKEIEFNKGLSLIINEDNSIKIVSKINFRWIDDGNEAKSFGNFLFDKKTKVDYPMYNFKYILKNDVRDPEFILKTKAGYLLVKTYIDNTQIDSPLYGEVPVTKLKYYVKKAYDNKLNKIDIPDNDILVKFIDDRGDIIALELMDEGIQKVTKSITPALKEFLKEKKIRKVKVNKFDFSKEKLYLTYISKRDSDVKRMNLEYSLNKKNIKVVLKSPISMFDPEYKDTTISTDVGILRELNNELYELKKVKIINGAIELSWLNLPKNQVVIVDYINEGMKDRKLFSKTRGQQFYAIEGVLYLVSWMDIKGIDKKIFTFVNGTFPFDVTMKKNGEHSYVMEKSSKSIYEFKLDKNHFLREIIYPAYNITIKLESIDNDTTLANKRFLNSFMEKNSIKLIKE